MPVRDKGHYLEYDNKEIRFLNGAGLLSRSPYLLDHFTKDLVAGEWTATETGAGGGKAAFAVAATANDGGYAVGVAGATTNNAEELAAKHVIWKPSILPADSRLVLEVRAKFVGSTTASDGEFFIALADAATYTNGRQYVIAANSTLSTTNPTEAAGFCYTSLASSGALFNSGGNNFIGTISTKANSGTVTASTFAKDSNFHTYRIQINSVGNVAYFYDDTLISTAGAAITAATALTPYIGVVGQNSHNNTATVDYVYVSGVSA